ncbi:hypothetical protein BH11CYA1_BH11CYA1_14950 [soil metagenome]
MNNSDDNRNNLPPPVTVIITLIVLTVIIVPTVILAQWWLYYSSSVLLWDINQTAVVSYSGMSVFMAILIVFGMRKLSQSTKPEDIERITSLVTEWIGWAMVLLAFSFSESQSVLHVSKHFYFPLAILGLALLGYSNGRRFKSKGDKTSLVAVFVVAMALAAEAFRYLSGLERLTF